MMVSVIIDIESSTVKFFRNDAVRLMDYPLSELLSIGEKSKIFITTFVEADSRLRHRGKNINIFESEVTSKTVRRIETNEGSIYVSQDCPSEKTFFYRSDLELLAANGVTVYISGKEPETICPTQLKRELDEISS